MGKSNAAMKEYVGRKERFADLFNYFLFQGELVIKPEDLEPEENTLCNACTQYAL